MRQILSTRTDRNPCTYTKAGGDGSFACDLCIRFKKPCIKIRMVDGYSEPVVVWHPLPEALRAGKETKELEYWIRPRPDSSQ